jgi:prolipoprotein diacylglyceryltransferase
LGTLVGLTWTLWQLRRRSWSELSASLNTVLMIAVASVIFGRAGYVLLHSDYYLEHPAEIAAMASPGFSEHAAITGGLIGLAIAIRLHQYVSPSALIILATLIGIGASLGCIPNGCAYGREVYWTDGWVWQLRVDWPDAYTLNNPRLPAQLFMLAWLAFCLVATYSTTLRHWKGLRDYRPALLWVLLFTAGDFVMQFLRADPAPVIGLLRAQQWADIALAGASMAWLALKRTQRDHP